MAEAAPDGIFILDEAARVIFSNSAVKRILGYPVREIVGRPAAVLVPQRLREQYLAGFERFLKSGASALRGEKAQIVAVARDGREVPLEISLGPFVEQGSSYVALFVRDMSEAQRVERRRALQYAVTHVLAEASTLEEAAPRLLNVVGTALQWGSGVLWLVDPKVDALRGIETWRAPSVAPSAFDVVSPETTFTRGIGLPGRVWASGQPIWIADIRQDEQFARVPAARESGLHGAMAFPMTFRRGVCGVLEFFSRDVTPPDDDLLALLGSIGAQIGQFVERVQAEREVRARARQQEAVATLGLEALAGATVLALMDHAVELITRVLGTEYAGVLELTPDRRRFQVRAVAGWGPEHVGRVGIDADGRSQAGATLMSERPVIVDDFRLETRFTSDGVLRDQGIVSGLCVLVQGSDRPFGVIGTHTTSQRLFTADDVHFVQAIANVLGMAIERGRADLERVRLLNQERQLRQEAEQAAVERMAVLGQIADGVVTADPGGHITFMNEAARRLLGLANASTDADFSELLTFEQATPASAQGPFTRTIERSETIVGTDARVQRPDGSEIVVQGSSTPVFARDGGRLGSVLTFHDVTAEREFEARKNEFIATVSHELRTPLTVIKGLAQYVTCRLGRSGRATEEDLRRLDKIDRTAQTMTVLINRLIEVTGRQMAPRIRGFAGPAPDIVPPVLPPEPLSDVALALNNAGAPRVAAIVVDECVRRFGATVADLWLTDSPRQELRLVGHRAVPRLSDTTSELPRQVPLGAATVAATAARSGEPVEVGDVGDVGQTLATSRRTLEREGLRSIYAQPLVAHGSLVGVLVVIFDVPRAFTADDRALLQAMGDLAAAAIARSRVDEAGQKAS